MRLPSQTRSRVSATLIKLKAQEEVEAYIEPVVRLRTAAQSRNGVDRTASNVAQLAGPHASPPSSLAYHSKSRSASSRLASAAPLARSGVACPSRVFSSVS